MSKAWFVIALCWLLGLVLPLPAQKAGRYTLTAQDVIRALRAAGANASPADVILQVPVTAAVTEPQLDVTDTSPAGVAGLQLRMACRVAGQCLPFFVRLSWTDASDALATQALLYSRLDTNRGRSSTGPTTLRAGRRATLLLEDTHMRITLPVVSIDTGAVGSMIRVASLDRKQTYRGVVTDADEVRGSLP